MTTIIRKPIVFKMECMNTGRLSSAGAEVSKNELMRRMLQVCQQNFLLEYRYVSGRQIRFSKGNIKETFGEVVATITRKAWANGVHASRLRRSNRTCQH